MPNYNGNPKISEYGQHTRFGMVNEAQPNQSYQTRSKPWSIRQAVRRLAAMDYQQFILILNNPDLQKKLNLSELAALSKFNAALQGDLKAMQQLEEALDGKL